MTKQVVCVGAGGHAVVVVDVLQRLRATDDVTLVGLIANTDDRNDLLGVPIIGGDEDLERLVRERDLTHFIIGVGSTRGGNALRTKLFLQGLDAGLEAFTAVHPAATVASSVTLGEGCVVMAGTVLQPRTVIGRNAILNTRCSIDHDCHLGDNVHVAPGAVLCGGVSLGDDVHVGAGATVLQNIRIGRGTTIAAGATVVRDCGDHVLLKGTPATAM